MMIPFIDLAAQQIRIREKIETRIMSVLDHGQYIMGPEVYELELELAKYCGVKHCISCANGTDAIQLILLALGLKKGDAVFVPSFTFAATAEVVPYTGATPIFVDVDPQTFNIDPNSLQRAVNHAHSLGLKPKVVIAVDLFGLPADYLQLETVAAKEELILVCDSAQSWGATINGRMTGSFGCATTTSFFPAKPFGCYGDGGAIFTDDSDLAASISSLRLHGQGSEKYENVSIGMNSRLDTLQAAILLEKLSIYTDELSSRNRIAKRYTAELRETFVTPYIPEGFTSTWAQYTLRARDADERHAVMAELKKYNIPSGIYYPCPLHKQPAYECFPKVPGGLAISESAASCVFSLPMHPYMSEETQLQIITVLKNYHESI